MLDYTDVLMTMHKYDNYIIPAIPKILTDYLVKHEEDYLLFLEKRFNIEDMLKHIAQSFKSDEEKIEDYLLKIILEYFKIGGQNA